MHGVRDEVDTIVGDGDTGICHAHGLNHTDPVITVEDVDGTLNALHLSPKGCNAPCGLVQPLGRTKRNQRPKPG
jgi:hypothetical protein